MNTSSNLNLFELLVKYSPMKFNNEIKTYRQSEHQYKKIEINKDDAITLGKKFNINFDIVDFDEWVNGLNIELEHGSKLGYITNITENDLDMTAKIAIAHLIEFPDYYKRLKDMEISADKYWESRKKPSIFNN